MARAILPRQRSRFAWLSRGILPLPDFCQDLLYHRLLDKWLADKPVIADAIIWDFAEGPIAYRDWPTDRKNQLRHAFPFHYPFELVDPPPNIAAPADADFPITVLSEEDAWRLYLNHVAQSLANDFWASFPWRLTELSPRDLTIMLDGRAFYDKNAEYGGYLISPNEAGWALSAPPHVAYQFMADQGLFGASRLETIANTLNWCRGNLAHYSGGMETANVEFQWQYRGLPPVSRIIAGTPNTNPAPGYTDSTLRHRTAGCHGTNGFLRALLRVVNIPVHYVRPTGVGHATPYFSSESMYLSHGDDPYNSFSRATPPYSAGELLIDQATYDGWFGAALSAAERTNNIGRQTYELALVHLADLLLQRHCTDLALGNSHDLSIVFQTFNRWYTVPQLEAMNLWQRLDAKVASFGGCDYIP